MLLKFLLLLGYSAYASLAIPSDDIHFSKLLALRKFDLEFYKNVTILEGVVENENFDQECLAQLQAIQNGLRFNQMWSIKFIDAWGKIPSGILYGNLLEMGNYDECLAIRHYVSTIERNIRGKYCLTKISMSQIQSTKELQPLQIGICIPAACRAEELGKPMADILKKLLNIEANDGVNSAVLLEESNCSTDDIVPFEFIDWAAICILSLLVLFMVASTIYDYVATHRGNPAHPLWVSFSMRANMRQLFDISSYNNAPHIIPCMHGLRSICIIWVILIHTYFRMSPAPSINNIDLNKWNRSVFANFWQGFMCVDTFFFLSGILVIKTVFRQMEKNAGALNITQMYLHRILRLTPVLALAVLLHMSINRYIGVGPMSQKIDQQCLDNWWATLLYVQNYAVGSAMCLPHSWYLAVDMQLYIISPLILMAIWKWKKKALIGLLMFGLVLSIKLIITMVIKNLSVLKIFGIYPDFMKEMDEIYFPTHTRAAPWIIGIVLGYYLYHRGGKGSTLSKSYIMIGWVCTVCTLILVLFAMHSSKQLEAPPLTAFEGALFLSFSRIAWPVATAWIVFACVNGFGGPINEFLSSPLWQPFSKLSYCLYIYHMEVVNINVARVKTNLYLSDYDAILRFWGDFGISLTISIAIYIAVESPIMNIDKYLLKSRSSHKPIK